MDFEKFDRQKRFLWAQQDKLRRRINVDRKWRRKFLREINSLKRTYSNYLNFDYDIVFDAKKTENDFVIARGSVDVEVGFRSIMAAELAYPLDNDGVRAKFDAFQIKLDDIFPNEKIEQLALDAGVECYIADQKRDFYSENWIETIRFFAKAKLPILDSVINADTYFLKYKGPKYLILLQEFDTVEECEKYDPCKVVNDPNAKLNNLIPNEKIYRWSSGKKFCNVTLSIMKKIIYKYSAWDDDEADDYYDVYDEDDDDYRFNWGDEPPIPLPNSDEQRLARSIIILLMYFSSVNFPPSSQNIKHFIVHIFEKKQKSELRNI